MVRELWGPHLSGNQGPGQPDKWQDEVMRAYDRRDRGIAVKACHNPGKTAVDAWIIWQQALFVFPQRTVVTAPSGPQLWDALWNEILVWYKRLPPAWQDLFTVKGDRIELKSAPEDSWISARTCRAETPEALSGVHCENGRVLLVPDEASGVPEAVFLAGAGSMAGNNATTIMTGNPTRVNGLFWEAFNKPGVKERWTTFTVNALTDTQRVPSAFIEDIVARHGRDSNEYRIRVLGEFPLQNANAYIARRWVDAAIARDVRPVPGAPIIWGVDPSRGGEGDRATLCKRQANVVLEPIKVIPIREPDTMRVVGFVKKEWEDTLPNSRPTEIIVDATGLGYGVADRLRELGLPARAVNASELASVAGERFHRIRDELWGAALAWLQQSNCKLPADPDLATELCIPEAEYKSSGETTIENKDKIKNRMSGLSPDLAEAFVMTFASDAATIIYGTSQSRTGNWNTPLKRALRGVV